MTYEELNNKIENGDYNTKLPYPPYRENPKDRESLKDIDRKLRDNYRLDEFRLKELFGADLRKVVEAEFGKPITDKQYQVIFNKAWEDGHSCGYSEVLIYASNYVDLIKEFLS